MLIPRSSYPQALPVEMSEALDCNGHCKASEGDTLLVLQTWLHRRKTAYKLPLRRWLESGDLRSPQGICY